MPQNIPQILLISTELFVLFALCCDCIVSCTECYPWASHLNPRNRTWQLMCNEQTSVWVNCEGTLRALRGFDCTVIFRTGKTAHPLSEPHSIGRRSRCAVIENSFLRIRGNKWERSVVVFVQGDCIIHCEYIRSFLYSFRKRDFVYDFITLTYARFLFHDLTKVIYRYSRSQWPRGLRRGSAAARLLRSWFRIPPGAWMFVCCECCVFLFRGLCDELITRPEESYRVWCVFVCDL